MLRHLSPKLWWSNLGIGILMVTIAISNSDRSLLHILLPVIISVLNLFVAGTLWERKYGRIDALAEKDRLPAH